MVKVNSIGIGIDCGTSGVRAVALNHAHQMIAQAQVALAEQTPQAWWHATDQTMQQLSLHLAPYLLKNAINEVALSLDATSSTLFLINQQGLPITHVAMYYDNHPLEAESIASMLSATSGAHGGSSSLAKALHLAKSLPKKTSWQICHQADWLIYQLTGKLGISDENNCLKLGFNAADRCWEPSTKSLIADKNLPKVYAPASPIGVLNKNLAERWHLPKSTQVATGTTDSIAAFLATKANKVGDAVISLGSTLAFKMLTKQPFFDPVSGIYSHRLWDTWLVGGASNAGGASLLSHFSLPEIEQISQQLLEYPLLHTHYYPLPKDRIGERFPINDPYMCAKLTPAFNTADMKLQAMLEGLVEIEQLGWEKLVQCTHQPIKRLFATGGGTKNPAWTGLRKKLLPYALHPADSDMAAIGSAMLALKSLTNEILM